MNYRFFDNIVGSAPVASQKFQFKEGKHSAKNYSEKTIEKFLESLHKILEIVQKLSKNVY